MSRLKPRPTTRKKQRSLPRCAFPRGAAIAAAVCVAWPTNAKLTSTGAMSREKSAPASVQREQS